MQTPRPLMFLCIFNLFEFTFCLLFVKSVCVTTCCNCYVLFPLVTRFSKHHMFIRYNILFFAFFFVFFFVLGKEERKRSDRGTLMDAFVHAIYQPFLSFSDPIPGALCPFVCSPSSSAFFLLLFPFFRTPRYCSPYSSRFRFVVVPPPSKLTSLLPVPYGIT